MADTLDDLPVLYVVTHRARPNVVLSKHRTIHGAINSRRVLAGENTSTHQICKHIGGGVIGPPLGGRELSDICSKASGGLGLNSMNSLFVGGPVAKIGWRGGYD